MSDARERLRILAVAGSGSFMAALSTNLVNVSAPVMARELALDAPAASLVMLVYLLAVSVLLPAVGRLAEVYGYKRVYLIGYAPSAPRRCAARHRRTHLLILRVLQVPRR